MHILWFILIGIAAGWLAGQIMKSGNSSLLTDLIIGVIGAVLGGFLFGLLGLSAKDSSEVWSQPRSGPLS
jgi:uncharacterized membrane protein YeaQ/YmgE (transglycosylase-associated protein family)